ncbi:hypothetical protein TELCIR_17157 [Teladorsagia circumcincta]|uniref:Uncharacterized protein n=1 Tax=Teladorsagia circumcincta TaxID=45464 RepID=A0A2G9TTJ1_TELCI|nr:hypothetical protein TELCIR_17157 [Teladorsagia circumcincta]
MSLFSLRKKLSLKKKKESEKVAETEDCLAGPFSLLGCELICREENTITIRLNEREATKSVVFTTEKDVETWMLLLGECWLSEYELLRSSVQEVNACGTFWLRQGATSEWMYAAAGLHERTMFYVLLDSPDYIYELDVRKARADGLLVPIHVWERENRPFNVKIDLAAEEVCRKAVARRGFDAPQDGNYAIFEVILSGALSRRLPPFEKLSVSVLDHWLPWQCTDGYLLFDHDNWPYDGNEIEFYTGKVKIAEPGSKTFHSYEVSVEGGVKITAYKHDKLWKEWIVADSVFYSGCGANRKAPYAHNVTILDKKTATMTEKLVGYCISFCLMPERTRFLNMIQFIETGGQPPPLVHL